MHPEIKKFWEQIGEVDLTPSAPIIYYVVDVKFPPGLCSSKYHYITIAHVWNGGPQDGPEQPTKYFLLDETQYTEDEMLNLIQQNAERMLQEIRQKILVPHSCKSPTRE